MSLKRVKKILINTILSTLLLFLICSFNGYHLTATSAFKAHERGMYYGPSEIVHVKNYKGKKYFLSKYDAWFSFVSMKHSYLLGWTSESYSYPNEIDPAAPLSFGIETLETETVSGKTVREVNGFYGIINDPRITSVDLTDKKGQVLSRARLYDDMFLTIYTDTEFPEYFIQGYDKKGNLVYRTDRPAYLKEDTE